MAWLLPAIGVLIALMPTGDLAYLIRVGDLMIDTGAIVRHDVLTYTVFGSPWVNQQWGAALILSEVHALAGWAGLALVRAAIVSLCFGITYRRARSAGADPMVCGVATLGAFVCVATLPGSLALRPQLLVAPLFVLSAWLIARRTSRPWGLVALPLIGVAWANLHGSFVLLPLLLGIGFVGDLAARRRLAWATGALAVGTSLTPMISPWGVGIYGYLTDLVTSPIVRVIDEWRPLVVRFPAGFVFVAACLLGGVVIWRRRERRPTLEEGLGLGAFTVLAALSGRNVLWWALFVPPVVAGLVRSWHPSTATSRRAGTIIVAALAGLTMLAAVRVIATRPGEALLADAPPGVTQALRALPAGDRVFAADWGGWFELAVPGVPMFVDPRAELFPEEIWDDFFDVATAEPAWSDVLDGWQVRTVVLDPTQHPDLDRVLAASGGWEVVYRDDDGAIFTRA
jgi:hypothetical protein